ncbi:NAD(P)-dependent malic enzyme [Candidatus Nanohalobium constans]|uniref:Malate dehydrogenase (Oxaloacetate-decarboxylating) n=1 Tax=Candidatus Nanohalobium constans TaxID=2565781 RepID=A0A5Q0UF47_9ARCH|nr:malic enzyme-like NAD(P)-binding protein [Candidatus Nanohalobium constans]QGA79971.1 malate dehydrogenase (oxaloacetate-decarboxylating) [Candidatus Nanohalobium constans]
MAEKEEALSLHSKKPGKISVEPSIDISTRKDLELVYTPGVAEPCRKISEDEEKAYDYTSKGNLVAVVSDGSSVLGLGDIGAEAAMPVMEGKANLMKKFGGVDGFPICINADSAEDIIEHVEREAPTFGAVNLEDIKAPRCFKAEEELKEKLDIPVFHDDQHGTAIVVGAALRNALELADKDLEDSRIVISGAGAAGIAVANFLLESGAENIVPADSSGILRTEDENSYKADLAERTLASEEEGDLEDAMENADVFIGLSAPGIVSQEMVGSMAQKPIVFALANPDPEIYPDEAKEAGAFITATGRSDFDNQVNNSLAFPGVFRGALDARTSEITEDMKIAASNVIKEFIDPEKDKIVPETLDKELAMEIADKVREEAD